MKRKSVIIRVPKPDSSRLLPITHHVYESQKDAIYELRNFALVHHCAIQGPMTCDHGPGRLYEVIEPLSGRDEWFRVLPISALEA